MAYQIRQGRLEDVTDLAEVEAACFPAAEAADEESLKERMTAFPECFFVAEEKNGRRFRKNYRLYQWSGCGSADDLR